MNDQVCSSKEVAHVAHELNVGHRAAAIQGINLCTIDLMHSSSSGDAVKTDLAKVIQGDPAATAIADKNFAHFAKQESHLWQTIKTAAHHKDPHGLCQLTVIENKEMGPHAELNGRRCR